MLDRAALPRCYDKRTVYTQSHRVVVAPAETVQGDLETSPPVTWRSLWPDIRRAIPHALAVIGLFGSLLIGAMAVMP